MKKGIGQQVYREGKYIFYTAKEKRILLGKSMGIVLILDYFFYQSLWAVIPLSAAGIIYYQMEKKLLRDEKREQLREQFKELLLLVSNGQKAGYSVENAFLSSYDDMKSLYGKESSICRIVRALSLGKENNIPFTSLWRQIGDQLDITEISEFADIYEISYKSSGNMTAIMEKTAAIIIHKIETDKEIRVLLSAKRLEQKIMNVMPFFIMIYINVTSPGYFKGLYHSVSGISIMSVCLFVYLAAYALSVRIITIEI